MRPFIVAVAVLALAAACRGGTQSGGTAPSGASVATTPAPTKARPAAPEPSGDERARAWFTDTRLVDQDGREVSFYSDVIAGRVVAMDFIFTRCQMACPLLTEKLNRIREALGPAFGEEVSFVSMSVDPANDTPQDLARFARVHRAVHPGWTWLTGSTEDVRRVLKRLGEWVDLPENHSTELIIGNARTRHWIKVRPDEPPAATVLRLKELVAEDSAVRDPVARAGRD